MSSKPGAGQQMHMVEVSASARPSEVVGAVLAGSQIRALPPNPNRWIQLSLAFVILFACIVYFREEIWAFGTDVSKHPIMAHAEQNQIKSYLGAEWLFGTGKDVAPGDAEAQAAIANVTRDADARTAQQESEAEKREAFRSKVLPSLQTGNNGAQQNGTTSSQVPAEKEAMAMAGLPLSGSLPGGGTGKAGLHPHGKAFPRHVRGGNMSRQGNYSRYLERKRQFNRTAGMLS